MTFSVVVLPNIFFSVCLNSCLPVSVDGGVVNIRLCTKRHDVASSFTAYKLSPMSNSQIFLVPGFALFVPKTMYRRSKVPGNIT